MPLTSDKYDGFCLGAWCSRIRKEYQEDKLNIEQVEKLKELNFDLRITKDIREEKVWDAFYKDIQVFINEYGTLPKVREKQNLQKWIAKQKSLLDQNRLPIEKANKIERIINL